MASSSSTNHLSRESSSAALNLEMSIFNDSGRRMCRPGSISLLLSQQLELLRPLLVKQCYRFPFSVKFSLNELGGGGVSPVWTQGGQHCAYGFLTYRRAQTFDGIPFDLTQMGVAFMRGIEVIPFITQHVYGRWIDDEVLPGITDHRLLVLSQYKLLALHTG